VTAKPAAERGPIRPQIPEDIITLSSSERIKETPPTKALELALTITPTALYTSPLAGYGKARLIRVLLPFFCLHFFFSPVFASVLIHRPRIRTISKVDSPAFDLPARRISGKAPLLSHYARTTTLRHG
jgi:hypothetical protein